MEMYRGDPVSGAKFFELLINSEQYCAELGRVVLAAGRLESLLILYLRDNCPSEIDSKSTLGKLIAYAKEHDLLTDLIQALEIIKEQRNYQMHNIYNLLMGMIKQTILEGENLIDSDVHTYIERALQLKENINALSDIVERECTKKN